MDSSHSDFMPRKSEPLPETQIPVIKNGIKVGAVVDSKNPADDEKEWLSVAPTTGVTLPEKYVTWASSDGKEIEDRFHSISGEAVKIVMKDGRSLMIPFSRLDSDSVEQAKKLRSLGNRSFVSPSCEVHLLKIVALVASRWSSINVTVALARSYALAATPHI